MDNINDIISSLTDEDIENLRAAAESFFGGDASPQKEKKPPENGMPDLSQLLGNAQMMAKLTSIMGAMNRKDSRSALIEALKPLLSEKRRRKADEAMQMIKLFDLLPQITEIMGGNGN